MIPPVNKVLEENRFDVVVYSLDWHPDNHVSFIDNVHMRPLHSSCKVRGGGRVSCSLVMGLGAGSGDGGSSGYKLHE